MRNIHLWSLHEFGNLPFIEEILYFTLHHPLKLQESWLVIQLFLPAGGGRVSVVLSDASLVQ